MTLDGENICLCVEVSDWSPLVTSSGDSKCVVLHCLQMLDVSGAKVGVEDGGSILQYWTDEGLVGGNKGFLVRVLPGASEGLHHRDFAGTLGLSD